MALSFLQLQQDTSNLTTYTFSAANLGVADSERHIIIAIGGKGGTAPTISSASIGGVSATIVVQRTSSANDMAVGLAIAKVPTGTTGDIVVTFNQGVLRCGVGVYRSVGYNATAYDTDTSQANDPSVSLDIPANGFAIGVAARGNNTTESWAGLTENFAATIEFVRLSGASDEFTNAESGRTITADFAEIVETGVGAFASWGSTGVSPSASTSPSSSRSPSSSASPSSSVSLSQSPSASQSPSSSISLSQSPSASTSPSSSISPSSSSSRSQSPSASVSPSTVNFPTTGILDDFNRANSTTTLGSNWSLMANYFGSIANQGILSNQLYNPGAQFANYTAMYWNQATYQNAEAYITISTRPSNANDNPAIYARMKDMGTAANNDGYLITADLDGGTVKLKRLDNGVETTLASVTQAIASGNKIGMSINGNVITGYVHTGSIWAEILQVTDSTYSAAGYLAVYIPGSSVNGRFDDFGGGSITGLSPSASVSPSSSVSLSQSPSSSTSPSGSVSLSQSPSASVSPSSSVSLSQSPSASISPSASESLSISPSSSDSPSRSPSASGSPSSSQSLSQSPSSSSSPSSSISLSRSPSASQSPSSSASPSSSESISVSPSPSPPPIEKQLILVDGKLALRISHGFYTMI